MKNVEITKIMNLQEIHHLHLGVQECEGGSLCIRASGNILASGNLCFRLFKLQLKVINKNVFYLYRVWVNQIN